MLNYHKRIVLSNLIYIMTMTNPMTIKVETTKIDSECSSNKEFTEFVCMKP